MKDLVTIENLRAAIIKSLDQTSVKDEEWIDQIASFVMDFFGYEDRILDNTLTPRDRDIFYMLEGMGLLKTEMEEATIQKGKVWRIHYWILNHDRILALLEEKNIEDQVDELTSEGKIYDNLPESEWQHQY